MKRILIADDEPNIVTALEFLLRSEGFEVQIARNGEEAVAMARENVPDLILLDVMMPLLGGLDTCRRIRERAGSAVKIVMLSARGGRADVEKGLAAGADLYVAKPFSTRELAQKIHGLLAAGVG
jgi:two-component system alkaline phosphatase synthesis response regulator PhoP